jgi:hypothetical protein
MVWISYRDGTLVQIDVASLFVTKRIGSTPWPTNNVLVSTNIDGSCDPNVIHVPKIQRFRLLLPANFSLSGSTASHPEECSQDNLILLPLPKYHASTTLPSFSLTESPVSCNWEGNLTNEPGVHQRVTEALVFCSAASNGLGGAPAIVFYTSGDYSLAAASIDGTDRKTGNYSKNLNNSDVLDVVLGGTKAIVTGVVGSALGAMKWGLRSSDERLALEKLAAKSPVRRHDALPANNPASDAANLPDDAVSPTYEAMHKNPTIYLVAGLEIHDVQRQISFATIDPDGNLAATADNLGRVLLIDLASKQVIRMWKGFREATCYWLHVPQHESSLSKVTLYLVIHSRHRQVVEIWRTRHGPRVLTLQVGRNAQILSFRERTPSETVVSMCCLADSTSPGTKSSHVEELVFLDNGFAMPSIPVAPEGSSLPKQENPSTATPLYQQLLADINVPCQSQDVYEALTRITSLKDLALALDLTAMSQVLEKRMGIDGAAFQTIAIKHCQDKLEKALGESNEEGVAMDNPSVILLKLKIDYYKQVWASVAVMLQSEQANFFTFVLVAG